jgi:hypothetical protein
MLRNSTAGRCCAFTVGVVMAVDLRFERYSHLHA